MKIGEVSARTGVSIETIRFYERQGILPAAARTSSGYRSYDEPAIGRLQFIRRAKELGFSLEEIGFLLSIREQDPSCKPVNEAAQEKLAAIDQKIADLQRIREALAGLLDACDGKASIEQCPIVAALEGRSSLAEF